RPLARGQAVGQANHAGSASAPLGYHQALKERQGGYRWFAGTAGITSVYQEFVEQKTDDPRLEAEQAAAYYRLAHIRREMGEHDQALADCQQARATYSRLTHEYPDDSEYRSRLAGIQANLGIILVELGRRDEAERACREAVELYGGLVKDFPL